MTSVKENSTDLITKAVKENNIGKVKQLIASGINVNKEDNFLNGDTPLSVAIEMGDAAMVRVLIEANAIVNDHLSMKSYLEIAIEGGNIQIVDLLLKAGANPNFEGNHGDRPLHTAVRSKSVRMVQLLCEANANPFLKNYDKETPLDLPMTDKLREALKQCISVPEKSFYSVNQILRSIRDSIQGNGTFVIQSQKTGQCYSDSFQHVLYFADGINKYFIQRAIERSKDIKTVGNLPLTKLNVLAKINTPAQATDLYLDFTGVRFLDMFRKPLLLPSPSKSTIASRRPSITSSISKQPMGIVCSKSLDVYEIVKGSYNTEKGKKKTEENFLNDNNNTLNSEGFGFVYEETAFALWQDMLSRIPSSLGKASIMGNTMLGSATKLRFETRYGNFRADPGWVVGILFAIYPIGTVLRSAEVGHAVSMVKTFGKWYICDDNLGVALPVSSIFSVELLSQGSFRLRYSKTSIDYFIHDPFKLKQWFIDNPGILPAPDEAAEHILASVPLKRSSEIKTYTEEDFGIGGFANNSLSRKYILWEPAAPPKNNKKNNKNTTRKATNNQLKALAAKYGITLE